ncbi:MAG: hypothetical protein ACNFW9_05910 [Candidatus Kerfeldbacteria bacterium]
MDKKTVARTIKVTTRLHDAKLEAAFRSTIMLMAVCDPNIKGESSVAGNIRTETIIYDNDKFVGPAGAASKSMISSYSEV